VETPSVPTLGPHGERRPRSFIASGMAPFGGLRPRSAFRGEAAPEHPIGALVSASDLSTVRPATRIEPVFAARSASVGRVNRAWSVGRLRPGVPDRDRPQPLAHGDSWLTKALQRCDRAQDSTYRGPGGRTSRARVPGGCFGVQGPFGGVQLSCSASPTMMPSGPRT